MKHLKLFEDIDYSEELSRDEYDKILSKTPVYYPVFKINTDYVELYTKKEYLITKGTEVYNDRIFEELRTLDEKNIMTEIPEEYLEFVEYRDKKEIDKQLEMYRQSNKYNI